MKPGNECWRGNATAALDVEVFRFAAVYLSEFRRFSGWRTDGENNRFIRDSGPSGRLWLAWGCWVRVRSGHSQSSTTEFYVRLHV